MSDLPMQQEDHPAHNLPDPTESYSGEEHQLSYDENKSTNARQMLEDRKNYGRNKY